MEEIVVTAQRVSKNLQKTPVAVTTLGGAALRERRITNILDLNSVAPNVSIGTRSGTGPASGGITIRGIGIDANAPASPSVGIYIDDVYFPGSFGNLLGLFDVARVEILRGPQGTLFGRNTLAGAIQYVTVKPTLDNFGGFVEGTVGNLNRGDVSAGINIPLGSIAALRVSGGITNRDGYVHDQLNDVNRGADRVDQGRAQLRIQPNDQLTIDLKGEYVGDRTNGTPAIAHDFNGNSIFGRPIGQNVLNTFVSPDYYNVKGFDAPDYAKTKFQIGQGELTYKLTDDITLKSISAYSVNKSLVLGDQDLSPLPIISNSRGDVTDALFTQELQAFGTSFGHRLHWTVGGSYYDDRATTDGTHSIIFGRLSNVFGNFSNITRSAAAYGQATYDITRKLSVVGGLRFTDETAQATDSFVPGVGTKTYTDVSPLIGLNYQLAPNVLLYFKDARGFRAGGFSPNIGGFNNYQPENATTYELGARMEFLNKRLRINPTIFLTDWNSIQFNALTFAQGPVGPPTPVPIIQNAGDANIKGAEIEVQAAVTDNLTLNGSASGLDSHYTFIAPPERANITLSSDLARSPRSGFTVGGRYVLPLGDDRSMAFNTNYVWQAHQRSASSDQDNVNIHQYGLLNTSIEFQPRGDRITITLFATNLTDQKYLIGGTDFGKGGVIPVDEWDIGPPREFGLTARVKF